MSDVTGEFETLLFATTFANAIAHLEVLEVESMNRAKSYTSTLDDGREITIDIVGWEPSRFVDAGLDADIMVSIDDEVTEGGVTLVRDHDGNWGPWVDLTAWLSESLVERFDGDKLAIVEIGAVCADSANLTR